VIEPNKILRTILKKNLNAKFYADDSNLKEAFDITLITTPPSIHLQLLERSAKRGDKKIFIEKPFGGYTNINHNNFSESSTVNIGYVLRFNPCIQWIKTNINPKEIKSIHGEYISNTIEKKPEGWRNSPFSGVLNEMGSHVIDLVQYIIGNDQMKVLSSKKESIISDVDDIVEATIKTENDISVSLYFNWVKKEVRKPVFGLEIEMKDGFKYSIDQQQVNKYNSNGDFIEKVSVIDLVKSVPYYLRGVDFTDQMLDLLGERKIMATVNEALEVNRLIAKILK
jgi:predicted dehydrogenase